ncbi:MAG: hypothetical protein AAB472_01545 [Patescibacteria group bacterium]
MSNEDVVSVFFGGFIRQHDSDPEGVLSGAMFDDYGLAELSEVAISDKDIRFRKRYLRRGAEIQGPAIDYVFQPAEDDPNTWVGEYFIDSGAGGEVKGLARCVITEVSSRPFGDDLKKFALDNGF